MFPEFGADDSRLWGFPEDPNLLSLLPTQGVEILRQSPNALIGGVAVLVTVAQGGAPP
jgi:hypothetical protein